MELSIKKYFEVIEEYDGVSVVGNLKCSCGGNYFSVYHTGKQTKGIFSSYVKKENKQILIEAKCDSCGKNISVYDTNIDGEKPLMIEHSESKQFFYKGVSNFKIKIYLNYYREYYMTNKFISIYIHLFDNNDKRIVLYEE